MSRTPRIRTRTRSKREVGSEGLPGAQEALGIDRLPIDPHFVMQMRACGAAGIADMADNRAGSDAFSYRDVDAGEMRVTRCQTVAVIDLDKIAVAAHRAAKVT